MRSLANASLVVCGLGAWVTTIIVAYVIGKDAAVKQSTEVVRRAIAFVESTLNYEDDGKPSDLTHDEWHMIHLRKQTEMIDSVKRLIGRR